MFIHKSDVQQAKQLMMMKKPNAEAISLICNMLANYAGWSNATLDQVIVCQNDLPNRLIERHDVDRQTATAVAFMKLGPNNFFFLNVTQQHHSKWRSSFEWKPTTPQHLH